MRLPPLTGSSAPFTNLPSLLAAIEDLGIKVDRLNAVVPPTNSPSTTEERNACVLPKRSIPIPNFWKRW